MKVHTLGIGALFAMAVAVATGVGASIATEAPPGPSIVVYKSASCGCCASWVDHLTENGFTVKVVNLDDLSEIKETSGVPQALRSCHTGIIQGYVVEGHVPADLVHRLLKERPKVAGLAVPGMPMGSPGMEGPTKEPYQVLTFDRSGATTVFAKR